MRAGIFAALALAGGVGLWVTSLLQGQEVPRTPGAAGRTTVRPVGEATADPDIANLPPLVQQIHLSARRGADWLFRMNGVKGRFLNGYVPALKNELDGDHYFRQAGAAFALARAARHFQEERYAVRAAQALLTLLEETQTEADDPQSRHTLLPSVVVNRLGSAGLLLAAIHELPSPQSDLLEKADQLANYLRKQARDDGSLICGDAGINGGADDPAVVQSCAGVALYGLARSQQARPADWKLGLLRKALPHYRAWWKEHRAPEFVPWQSAAWAAFHALTRDEAAAAFVCEMNDWVCTLQYERIDPRRLGWYGGFRSWSNGRAVDTAPTVRSAELAGSLAEACALARTLGDAERHQRYVDALERSLQFLTTLQYSDANTQHFADWYRPRLVGAFHASHQDGDLRIDYTQHAVAAMVRYLAQPR